MDDMEAVHEASSYLKNWRAAADQYVVTIPSELHGHLTAITQKSITSLGSLVKVLSIDPYTVQNRKKSAQNGKSFVQQELFPQVI